MTSRRLSSFFTFARPAVLAALLLGSAASHAQNDGSGVAQARVLSSTPLTEQGQVSGYSVEYEYAGRRYTTRLPDSPGASLPVQVTPLGVSTFAVAPPNAPPATPLTPGTSVATAQEAPLWAQVQAESGVVVSGNGQAYGAPTYSDGNGYPYGAIATQAPALVYAPPVFAPGYGYPYSYAPASAWARPPVALSFNLGYSRGWRHSHGHPGRYGYARRGWR